MFGDKGDSLKEIDSSHEILKSSGYFMVNYSSEGLTKKAYYLPDGAKRDSDNLIPCKIVNSGFNVNSYCDGFGITLEGSSEVIKTTVDSVFFKEFEGEVK